MPVADLEQAIRDRVYVFLENLVSWELNTDDADARALTVAAVCAELNKRLRDFQFGGKYSSVFTIGPRCT